MALNCRQIKIAKRCHMSAQEKTEKKINTIISELFRIVIELNQEQQKEVLDHAEQLLAKDKRGEYQKIMRYFGQLRSK